jgi:hypothetical protein
MEQKSKVLEFADRLINAAQLTTTIGLQKKALPDLRWKPYNGILSVSIVLMDIHLDTLLNLAQVSIESCTRQDNEAYLKLRLLNEEASCSHWVRVTFYREKRNALTCHD